MKREPCPCFACESVRTYLRGLPPRNDAPEPSYIALTPDEARHVEEAIEAVDQRIVFAEEWGREKSLLRDALALLKSKRGER